MTKHETIQTFRREPLPLSPGNSFVRLLTANAIASFARTTPADVAEKLWPNDRVMAQITVRAASAPAMTSVAGWASDLAHKMVHDALEALGPASAGGALLRSSTVLAWDNYGIISAPGFVASAANAGFVAEGDPIPVRQLADTAVQLLPYKLASIAVLSEEMMRSSNAETLIGDTLVRSAAAALDVALFDSNAATTARPAGLRNGIAALTASTNTDFWEAYFEDIANALNACAPVGGNGPYTLVGNPGRAVQIQLRAMGNQPYQILGSSAVGNDMITIAPAAVVCAISPNPEVEATNAGTLHMDSAPSQIVSGGVSASPVRSVFQTASVALKMRWPVSWALRDTRGVSWVTPAWK